jgi:hypothetical protein
MSVLKILMEWSLTNKQYNMSLFLYEELRIGIPNKYLYQFPTKNKYSDIQSFLKNSDSIGCENDIYLKKILILFHTSKYQRLEEWDNNFGYKKIAITY